MSDSLQNVYAKSLPTKYGYPLRIPEPSTNLPEIYLENGLQIGDVGYVDPHGAFRVLFNVRFSPDHVLHRKYRPPSGFDPIELDDDEVTVNSQSIASGQIISSPHITQKLPEQPDERVRYYRFVSSAPSGAILILPSGAIQYELNETTMEEFRRIAVEHAQRWCAEARRDSVYLITGFHKARSWSLGSFDNAPRDGEIIVTRLDEDDENTEVHEWAYTFFVPWRASPRVTLTGNPNQTVFISGFKVTVRSWLWIPDVELLHRPSNALVVFFRLFFTLLKYILSVLWTSIVLKRNERVYFLSPPFHLSDAINRRLLAQNPKAHVAITHDRQWMELLKTDESDDMANENYVWEILSGECALASHSDVVWLESKSQDANARPGVPSRVSSTPNDNTPITITEGASQLCSEHSGFSLRTPSLDKPWIAISRIRADGVVAGLSRLPVGFYVLLEFNGIRRRTKIRSPLVCESVISWDDEIILSDDPSTKIQLSFCAAFEFEPMLSEGSILCTAKITVGTLVGSTTVIGGFSVARDSDRCSSLMITVERRYLPNLDTYSRRETHSSPWETSSAMAHETNIGRQALLRYYEDYRHEDLRTAIDCFQCALRVCRTDDECLAAAQFNLATVRLHEFEASGTDTSITESISLYRDALEMRRAPHPDRPLTLLSLGQALLYRYQSQGRDESLADDLEKLMLEVKMTCAEGSHWRRAAILVLQTYRRIQVEFRSSSSELDHLISELEATVRRPPCSYFDQPYRLQNLSLALKQRFVIQGEHGRVVDLEEAITYQEEVLRHVHEQCPRYASHLSHLSESLWIRFDKFGNIEDLNRAIVMTEEAVKLTLDSYPCRAHYLMNLGVSLHARFNKLNDIEDLEQAIVMEEEAMKLIPDSHPRRARYLKNLGVSLHARFNKLSDIKNLERAIVTKEGALRLTPDNHPRRARYLKSLGVSLHARFNKLNDIKDLERAIIMEEEALTLTPDGHPRRTQYLKNLRVSLHARFNKFKDVKDLERAIVMEEEAMKLIPDSHPCRAQYLEDLGISLHIRFNKLDDIKDLERAIGMGEEAVKLTPNSHPHRARYLRNLAVSLYARFDELGDIKDLEQAVARQKEVVELTLEDDACWPRRLGSLDELFDGCDTRNSKSDSELSDWEAE